MHFHIYSLSIVCCRILPYFGTADCLKILKDAIKSKTITRMQADFRTLNYGPALIFLHLTTDHIIIHAFGSLNYG
jgi:hypothetical protein